MTETAGPIMEKFPGNTDSTCLGINLDRKKCLEREGWILRGEKKISIGGGGSGDEGDFLKECWCFYKCHIYKKQLHSIADVSEEWYYFLDSPK